MPRRSEGFTLIEMAVAVAMLGVSLLAVTFFITNAIHGTGHNADKDFASQKAIAMLEELKTVVESSDPQNVVVLDDYDDGANFNPVLTTLETVTDPTHVASGNFTKGPNWHYVRQVSIRRFASLDTNDVRIVNVKVFGIVDGNYELLAETAGVIRTLASLHPPTQVYDVYMIAVENVPGWWVHMSTIVPFVATTLADLQARNPGLEFRTHWIRKMSYGRNPEYTPYFNVAQDSNADIDYTYMYPSAMPSGSANPWYYVPTAVDAKINIDGTVVNGYDATDNPAPYTLADQFNHAMRLQDERDLFNQRVAAGLEDPDTPTLRLLLEDMYTNPTDYLNAIVLNLHGELFPFPPLRNYSDPAKDPVGHPHVRVVTHPENLRYSNSNTEKVVLRVYSYLTDPTVAVDQLSVPITLQIKGLTLNNSDVWVRGFEGGVGATPFPYYQDSNDTSDSNPTDMYYEFSTSGGDTILKLYRSPLKVPCEDATCSSGGLSDSLPDSRLYGLEYIPAWPGVAGKDIDDPTQFPKNTARWIIEIEPTALPTDSQLEFVTRIGDDLTTGQLYPTSNEPTNISRTYTWRGSSTWAFGDGTRANPGNVPLTERYQILGDPRHVPYRDSLQSYNATTNPLGVGYNRYFDDFEDSSGSAAALWNNSWAVKNDGTIDNDHWNDRTEVDANRIFQVLRSSLMRSNAIWTTMSGWSYYYIGLGNEVGYDGTNGFPLSVPVSTKPYNGSTGSLYAQIFLAEGVKMIKENDGGPWWSMHWLGELYPDEHYSDWTTANGNLPTGTGDGTFVRVPKNQITTNLPKGTTFIYSERRSSQLGSTTFFSTGTATSKFHHTFNSSGVAPLGADGTEVAGAYNLPVPNQILINRPFNYNVNGTVPDNYLEPTYTGGTALTANELAKYYQSISPSMSGAALLSLDRTGDDKMYVAVNGISDSGLSGSGFLSAWALTTMIHSFMAAGLETGTDRVPQVPRVEIVSPDEMTDLSSPSSITIDWDNNWRRWDNQQYTANYSPTFAETNPMRFVTTYSPDNGANWYYMQNDQPATLGERPGGSVPFTTTTSYNWSTSPTSFPEGSYWVRVEGYRADRKLHYAYHQRKIFIER